MIRYAVTVADLNSSLPIPAVTPRDPVAPPAVIVRPGSPWIESGTLCGEYVERYELLTIAGTVDAQDVDRLLADTVAVVLDAVDDLDALELVDVDPPDVVNIGGVDYLAAVVNITT